MYGRNERLMADVETVGKGGAALPDSSDQLLTLTVSRWTSTKHSIIETFIQTVG